MTDLNDLFDDAVDAGALVEANREAALAAFAAWSDTERAEVGCWVSDLCLWRTDFVSFNLGPMPDALRVLLVGMGRLSLVERWT